MSNKVLKKDSIYTNVFKTYNYNQFIFASWNRKIDYEHVQKLEKSLLKEQYLIPIIVKYCKDIDKYIILDGQHRFIAIQKNNMPLYYIVEPSNKLSKNYNEIILAVNTTSKKWGTWAYVEAYENAGNKEYKKITEFRKKFNMFRKNSMYLNLLALSNRKDVYSILKSGNFIVRDLDKSIYDANSLLNLKNCIAFTKENINPCKNYSLFRALLLFINHWQYDEKRMINKLNSYPDKFYKCVSIEHYKNVILEIYNYNQKGNTKLFFQ